MSTKITGNIERITFHNEDNGYVVLKVQIPGKRELVTVVGTLSSVVSGEYIEALGEWVTDRAHGLQFKASEIRNTPPHTLAGIIKYLGSGLVKGIGPTYAKKIVEVFGEKTLEVIDQSPTFLSEVKGIGPQRLKMIRDSWAEQRGVRDIMVFLQSYGIGTHRAIRIFKTYGEKAIEQVKSNPYRLSADIWGVGFRTADELALRMGIQPDSPLRARAAVRYILTQMALDGHVGYPEELVIQKTMEETLPACEVDSNNSEEKMESENLHSEENRLEKKQSKETDSENQNRKKMLSPDLIRQAIEVGRQEDEFVREYPPTTKIGTEQNELEQKNSEVKSSSPVSHFPTETDKQSWLFLKPLFMAELGIARAILQLQEGDHPLPQIDVDRALNWVETKMGITLAPKQREAIQVSTQQKVLIITGGPGVGKTTIVRGILEIFAAKQLRIALAAPTGRAAKRLTESTNREAKTIHRLLEFDPAQGGFKRDRERPLDIDLLVVDETSMVDIVLMNQLLRALPPWTCLILVGDMDQLPSVGPGSLLADLIASQVVHTVRLNEIFRQANTSYIIQAAHAINHGELPESAPPYQGDFYFIEENQPEKILDKILFYVQDRLPKRYGFDSKSDIQVLSPMKKSHLGVLHFNERLQAILNPPSEQKAELSRMGTTFREGDKILQLKNNYQKEVFNGDVGWITSINPTEREILIRFDHREVPFDFNELDEITLAYCCSIHKSQGSEYPVVILPLHTQHFKMLQRNLLYTAITRGRKMVVVVGSRYALQLAVKQIDVQKRYSLLQERLQILKSTPKTRTSAHKVPLAVTEQIKK